MAVAAANDAFERSGALVSLNLVGAEQVDYSETNKHTALRHLVDRDDGQMDGVHDVRDALGADLVYLVAAVSGGVAELGGAFAVGTTGAFAHEIGHNMGLHHDRYDRGPSGFAHGFIESGDLCRRTIMGVWAQCIDRGAPPGSFSLYSTPWRYESRTGIPLGVARQSNLRGSRGPADAVLAINRNRHAVANFRPGRDVRGRLSVAADPVTEAAGNPGTVLRRPLEATDDADTLVNIPDAVLRRSFERALGKESGGDITRREMADVDILSAQDVQSLVGIEHAVNLRELELNSSTFSSVITDISPLAALTSLTDLDLRRNAISDVSPLAALTSLTVLDLSENHGYDDAGYHAWDALSDVSPLADLTSLTVLRLQQNYAISDVSPLKGLMSLRSLHLYGNHISDVSVLADLTSLRFLGLTANEVWDVSPLADLRYLTVLALNGNIISDVAPLRDLVQLRVLDLDDNFISEIAPLARLPSLTRLSVAKNKISDVSPLLQNEGLGDGDVLDLRANPLHAESLDMHIPALIERGVDVQFEASPIPEGWEVVEIADSGLRAALERRLSKGSRWWIASQELVRLEGLVASNSAIERLDGLEEATALRRLDLSGNAIADLTPLANLRRLSTLFLGENVVGDVEPLMGLTQLRTLALPHNLLKGQSLGGMISLTYLALDGNSLRELPSFTNRNHLQYLYLADNSIADIDALADQDALIELDISGNSIASLEPLVGLQKLEFLDVNDNEISDISPLVSFSADRYEDSVYGAGLRELHMANNAVRDITPLLDGEGLLMVDARRNPLADDALAVLETLRERRVTVLAGETVPYFPAVGQPREGFVRVVNHSDQNGHVFIEAVDDAGVRAGPVRLRVLRRRAIHFDSADLEYGMAARRLEGIGPPTAGDWRLSVISALDIEVLSYIRTEDGFFTAMHDVVPDAMAAFFNPGDARQRSVLRTVNMEAEPAKWTTGGYDDRGRWRPMAGSMLVRPQHALTLTGDALEDMHGLGDGEGRWRLRVRGFPWFAMSLLENPTGHLTNLSTVPDNATPLADGRTMHRLPLFPVADGSREGIVRVINRSHSSGEVTIEGVDDAGARSRPVQLTVAPRRAVELSATDLEHGNVEKGLAGRLGVGEGDWRLEVVSELELMVLSYVQTADGFLASLHDVAPVAENGGHRVVFFKPGSNRWQVSKLRLVNDGERAASVRIAGIDDRGVDSGMVTLTVPAGSALTFTSAELETGSERLASSLGDGYGQWRLRVHSDEPIAVMSLLETQGGLLANMSTGTAD